MLRNDNADHSLVNVTSAQQPSSKQRSLFSQRAECAMSVESRQWRGYLAKAGRVNPWDRRCMYVCTQSIRCLMDVVQIGTLFPLAVVAVVVVVDVRKKKTWLKARGGDQSTKPTGNQKKKTGCR